MGYIAEGLRGAISLLIQMNEDVYSALFVSLRVSSSAIGIASLIGVPSGFLLAMAEFRGKGAAITVLNTLMSLPTVVVGLLVYSLLSRQGPLGPLGLLYTTKAMIVGQVILATPIVTALAHSATRSVDARARFTAMTLGAGRFQAARTVLAEGRFALLAAVTAGFGRIIGEVGAAVMLGGNIRGYTRTLTTAIALETNKGEFGFGIALGVVLMIISLGVNVLFRYLQGRGG